VDTTPPPKEPAVRRSLLPIAIALLLGLVAAPPAVGGGWATAGLSSMPDGVAPGEPWNVEITVLQHGRTPLDGLAPTVRIRSGDTMRSFPAEPAGRAGVYRAEVVFPAAGRWRYEVLDGFNNDRPHTYPAVEIGDSPAATDSGGIAAGWLWGAGAALLLALAVLGVDRRRRAGALAVSFLRANARR
jgi:hypothetical protein